MAYYEKKAVNKMEKGFILDRMEGDIAVLETSQGVQNVARALLPMDAREGDVLFRVHERYERDIEATKERRALVDALKKGWKNR